MKKELRGVVEENADLEKLGKKHPRATGTALKSN
jgi:hypothetical protein